LPALAATPEKNSAKNGEVLTGAFIQG